MTEEQKALSKIASEVFGCEKMFLDEPYYDEEELAPVTLTKEGEDVYSKITSLLYNIGTLTGRKVNGLVDAVDSIVSEL